jgi:hypothetical protein
MPNHWDRLIELALLGGLVITGIIQLGIADRQGKITKRQTEIMERQVKLSEVVERPWIAIEGIEVRKPLAFNGGRIRLEIRLDLKNTGHVPGTHVLIFGRFIFRSKNPKELDVIWEGCEQFRTIPIEARGSGVSIFPDQQQGLTYGAIMSSEDVTQLGMSATNGGAALFAGCIDYGWGDAVTRHQTRFVYEIDKKGSGGFATMISPADGDIPIADVMVNLNPLLAGDPD